MSEIRNIIFDLGGVIINLDTNRTIEAFNRIGQTPFNEIYDHGKQDAIFNRFDKGQINETDFFTELKEKIGHKGTDEEMLLAWNAMLLDIPESRLDMLVRVKQNYRSYLLSNTCEPHISSIEHELYLQHGVKNFADYFDRIFYSCRVGMRKPEKEIFEYVLKAAGLEPHETVFIDDTVHHVKAAGECGINAHLLPRGMEVEELLKELRLL